MIRSLAITGVGSVSALGDGPEPLLRALDLGRRGFSRQEPEAPTALSNPWAGTVRSFDPSPYLPPLRARRLDRASLFAVAAARQALAAAGLEGSPPEEVGIILGTSSAGAGPLTTFLRTLLTESPEKAPPFEFPNTVANAPASHVSIELDLKGPNVTLAQKQSAIAPVLLYADLLLADGRCSALLAGASDEWNPVYQLGYDALGALRAGPDPGPAPGMLLGEGATILALEPAAAAATRGAPTLARLLAVESASVPGENFLWLPAPGAFEGTIRKALAAAGLGPGDVGSVVLAANGVREMEEAEARALARIFPGRRLPASGVKGALGEAAASGAASVATAAQARARGALPPYAGGALAHWPDAVDPLTAPAPLPPGATLVLTYGVGGTHGTILLG